MVLKRDFTKSAIEESGEGGEVKEYILTREDITFGSAQWIQDGVYYLLFAMRDSATEEELLFMVEELITSE